MRKGVSPIIATVLLIAITITLALAIFSSSNEIIDDLSPAPNCDSVSFEAGIFFQNNRYYLEVSNTGNEKISSFELSIIDEAIGSTDIKNIDLIIDAGGSVSEEITFDSSPSGKIIKLTPLILNKEDAPKVCDRDFARNVAITTITSGGTPGGGGTPTGGGTPGSGTPGGGGTPTGGGTTISTQDPDATGELPKDPDATE